MVRPSRSGFSNKRQGATAVEMAFLLPVFMTVILGVIETTRLGMVSQRLTDAARAGGRLAVRPETTLEQVRFRVEESLAGSGIPVENIIPFPQDWQSAAKGTPISLNLEVPYNQISLLPTPFLFGGSTISASATYSSERF